MDNRIVRMTQFDDAFMKSKGRIISFYLYIDIL